MPSARNNHGLCTRITVASSFVLQPVLLGAFWSIATTLLGAYLCNQEIGVTNGFLLRSIRLNDLRSIGYRRSGAGAKLLLTDDSGRTMSINIRGFKRDDEWETCCWRQPIETAQQLTREHAEALPTQMAPVVGGFQGIDPWFSGTDGTIWCRCLPKEEHGYFVHLTPNPPGPPAPPPAPVLADFGLLAGLVGTWVGKGFNALWRPNALSSGQDRFLELNVTRETLSFEEIGGPIPNRGLLQPDIFMAGLSYLQKIGDENLQPPNDGLHFEPGVWLNVPGTTNPAVSASVARLASVPHGVTVLLQGLASSSTGPPSIPATNLNPFSINNPGSAAAFPEQNLGTSTQFRSAGPGIDQEMIDNPNIVLTRALVRQLLRR